jgi:hypothetical protein
MTEWLAGMSSAVDAGAATLLVSTAALAAVVYGPRPPRRRRLRASPDFRNTVMILGVMWGVCILALGVLLLLKR